MPQRTQTPPRAIYQLKLTLKRSRPPIWRRVQVRDDIQLSSLHRIIQRSMGWSDYHLHQFSVGDSLFGIPDPDGWEEVSDDRRVRLNQLGLREKSRFIYEYDFGDGWDHQIVVEKILPPDTDVRYPICLTGKRACPPEDVGGVWGYESFIEAIGDPGHEEHETMLDWIGRAFDPEAFDLDKVNARLRSVR